MFCGLYVEAKWVRGQIKSGEESPHSKSFATVYNIFDSLMRMPVEGDWPTHIYKISPSQAYLEVVFVNLSAGQSPSAGLSYIFLFLPIAPEGRYGLKSVALNGL